MPVSNKKCTELYKDISDPITDLRLFTNRFASVTTEQLDEELFKLEQKIWAKVKKTLNIKY